MNLKSLIMPVLLTGFLGLTLPVAGVHGSAIAVSAVALAVFAWGVGRLTFHMAGYFTRVDATCTGLFVTLATTLGLGFLGSLFILGGLTDALKEQIVWTSSLAPALISLGVCFGSLVLRIIVNAVLPDKKNEQVRSQ